MSGENKFDVRNIERNLRNNKLSAEEYQEYLAGLEDFSDLMVECEAQFTHRAKAELEKEAAKEEQE
jgi:hypothetical protein